MYIVPYISNQLFVWHIDTDRELKRLYTQRLKHYQQSGGWWYNHWAPSYNYSPNY